MDISKEDVIEWLEWRKFKIGDGDHMNCMEDLVCTFEDKSVSLKNPDGAKWVICDLHATIYKNNKDVVNGWEQFYLPDEVKMQVIGKVTGTSYPCEQLVLMTCKDGNIYAYDEEELHVVASSPEQLCSEGLQDPASLSYYKGEAFKDMTDEDWNEVRQGKVGRSLDRAHNALVMAHKSCFLESFKKGHKVKWSMRMLKWELQGYVKNKYGIASSSGDSSPEEEMLTGRKKSGKGKLQKYSAQEEEMQTEKSILQKYSMQEEEMLMGRKKSGKGTLQKFSMQEEEMLTGRRKSDFYADRIRRKLEILEKQIEDGIRQKYGPMSSSGHSSSDKGAMTMLTDESKKGAQQRLSFKSTSLADVLATKQWTDPSRASRVTEIMEKLESSIVTECESAMWPMYSSEVKWLMKELKKEIEDDVWQRLGLKSVSPALGDSSGQTKAMITPAEIVKGTLEMD